MPVGECGEPYHPRGEIIYYAYYMNGWLKAVSNPTGNISEYTYDEYYNVQRIKL